MAGNVRALKVALKGEENDEILKAIGLQESLMGVMGDVFFEGAPKTPFVSFARAVLKWMPRWMPKQELVQWERRGT